MLRKWGRTRLAALVLTVFMALCSMGTAYAGEIAPEDAMFLADDPTTLSVAVINFKATLFDLGFYVQGVDDSILQSVELDQVTMAAVHSVCDLNPELTYYTNGISNELYWRVDDWTGKKRGVKLKTPLSEEYRVLTLGETGEDVTSVQNRLNQLGYDRAGYSFEPGVYNDSLQKVINIFVQYNKMEYRPEDGITVSVQERLFSNDVISYPEDAVVEKNDLASRVFRWLGAGTAIMGVVLPNVAILVIGFVLLCLIAVLILKLTKSSDGSSGRKGGRSSKAGEIEFRVEYGGETVPYRVGLNEYVRIGRATGNFPLNMADGSISRKHCEIYYKDGNLMLTDFSSYGTKVNGTVCHHGQQVLHSGDLIEVGDHRITVRFMK